MQKYFYHQLVVVVELVFSVNVMCLSGGGEALPTETPHFTRKELQHGARLACQVKVKQDMEYYHS